MYTVNSTELPTLYSGDTESQNRIAESLLLHLNQLPNFTNLSPSFLIKKEIGVRQFPGWFSQFNTSLFYRALFHYSYFNGSRNFGNEHIWVTEIYFENC